MAKPTDLVQGTLDLLKRFYALSEMLEDKLGCLLFQLPPQIKKNMELLNTMVEQLDHEKKNVIEFRDKSWFDQEVYEFLSENEVTFCSVSAPGFPEDLIISSPRVYVRFHGTDANKRYMHLYSRAELEEWASNIRNADASEVFCYFNNDYQANAVHNCEELRDMLLDK